MKEEIVCAGFGGQGVLFMGKLLANAAVLENKFTTWMPSYGAEVRGGTAHSMLIISDEPIASAVIARPDAAIIMNKPSLIKFEKRIKPGGLLVINKSLIDETPKRDDVEFLAVDMTETASRLGNTRVANMVGLGAYLSKKSPVSIDSVIKSLDKVLSPDKKNLIALNEKALLEGARLVTK